MTMPFINADLVDNVIKRLELEWQSRKPMPFRMPPVIVPTIDAGQSLDLIEHERLTNVDPGATGFYEAWTIPVDEIWWIYGGRIYKATGATLTTSGVGHGGTGFTTWFLAAWGASADESWKPVFPTPCTGQQGSQAMIGFQIAAYTAGDTMTGSMLVRKQKKIAYV